MSGVIVLVAALRGHGVGGLKGRFPGRNELEVGGNDLPTDCAGRSWTR